MKRLLIALPASLAAACAAQPQIYQPIANPAYSAIGRDPFWMVAIGDDRIVLRMGHDGGEAAGEYDDIVFPRTLPRTAGNVRIWQSGQGPQGIAVEARPGPCGDGRRRFADHVIVRFGDRELVGCGGRLLGRARR